MLSFCLFTVQRESPVLFAKCGNISQPDQCAQPQRGATYHMSHPGSQKKKREKKKRVSETPHPLCVGCHLHPRETFPALQMSVGNYSGVSNALRQPERRRLALKREAVWQFFLGILWEIACSWKTVKVSKLGGQSLYPFLPPFKNQISWTFPFLSIHHFATPVY